MESGIELRHLRYAIAAAEQGSFRRAAELMGIRVSALSRCIRDLEDRIGAALFIRRSHGVQLTFAGKMFFPRACRVMAEIGEAIREAGAAGAGREGVIRIGLLSSLAGDFPAMLTTIHRAVYADVETSYAEAGTAEHVLAIRQHRLDIAFLPHPVEGDDCDSLALWSERIFVAMGESDPLSRQETVEWTDLGGRHLIFSAAPPGPEIQQCVKMRLMELGFQPSVDLVTIYRDTVMHVVAAGADLTLVGEARASEPFRGLVYRPLLGESLPFHAVWLSENDNPALRRFLSLAKVLAKQCAGCAARTDRHDVQDDDRSQAGALSGDRDAALTERLGRIVPKRCVDCLLRNVLTD
ncbi:LysR family transcriptional regulator [Azospirillum agricola]|uniref:LysR family transcriptional regulator n=1 Tax=Azospirillum agricola TaxID=1720247 RepID=UPI000A0F373E|nr:LysR family transcriptional regulator [Azospirillum agricola]SMH43267.1 transcriptional regulator, LysR family [Azospirillum lipoferum]